MRRVLGIIALALSVAAGGAGLAMAQSVQVRSGEHDGFSRLVIQIGADRDWTLDTGGPRQRIRFDPAIATFDLSQVFTLIPRTRLANLVAEDGLRLELACDCPITGFRHAEDYLVIDIKDPQPDQTRDSAPSSVAPQSRPDDSPGARLDGAPSTTFPSLAEQILAARDPAPPVPQSPPVDARATTASNPPIALEEAARIMAEQLARAAATGLIEAAPLRPLSDADPVRNRPDPDAAAAPDAELPEDARAEPDPPPLPIRAETAADAALHAVREALPPTDPLACSGHSSPMTHWAPNADFTADLGGLRAAVYDDRDAQDPDAILDLARHYLSFGFGAEAAYWAEQHPQAPPWVLPLAHLIDGAQGPQFPPAPDASACSAEEILWRVIDRSQPADLTQEQVAHVQRAAAELPPVLRDHLGPRLARALAALGHSQAAHNIRDMLVRGGRLSAHAQLHLDLDLGLSTGQGDAATRADLTTALRDAGSDAPEAMAQALRFDRLTGIRPAPDRLLAADALLREHGPSEARATLWHEVTLAHIWLGNLEHALGLLSQPPSEARRAAALTQAIADRVSEEDTTALLALAHGFGATWTAQGTDAGRARVAAMAHLRAAGFADAAEAMRAGQRMLILPARPPVPSAPQDGVQTAWLTEDWQRLEGLVTGAHADLAVRMQSIDQATIGGAPPEATDLNLSAVTDLLADSSALRASLAEVLQDPRPRLRESPP